MAGGRVERKELQKGWRGRRKGGKWRSEWEVRPDGLVDKKKFLRPGFLRQILVACVRVAVRGLKQEREGELIGERSGPFEK